MNVKYTTTGQAVSLIKTLDDEYLVAPILVYGDGEEYESDQLTIVGKLYDDPPTEKLEQHVAELNDQIRDAQRKLMDVRIELRNAERDHKARLDEYAKYDALKHLDDIIAGRITHYVFESQYGSPPVIIESGKILDRDHHSGNSQITLNITAGRRIEMTCYMKVDKGYDTIYGKCTPCLSYESAVEKEAELLYARMEKETSQRLVETCEKYGVDVPASYRQRLRDQDRADLEREITKARETLEQLEGKLRQTLDT